MLCCSEISMAWLDMYNSSEQNKSHHHHMSPRISFSNDFVDVQQVERSSRSSSYTNQVAGSSDFEFSTTKYSMMSADELFSKGRLLPYKNDKMQNRATTTLKEELLVNDDDEYDQYGFSLQPPKGSRWKGLLGLRKSHIGSKKVDKSSTTEGSNSQVRKGDERSQPNFTFQEVVNEGSSS